MNDGKRFENDWKASVPSDCKYHRIRDSAQSFGGSDQLRFSSKNPYDHEIYKYPNLFCIEQKSTKEKSVSFERIGEKSTSSPMIKSYQLSGLLESSKYKGTISGLLLNFRGYSQTYFIHISDFLSFIDLTPKKSINQIDISSIRHVVIEQTLKRTHYSYNVSKFISDCIEKYGSP